MLARDPAGRLELPAHRAATLPGLFDELAVRPDAARHFGALLKLARSLRTKHDAPAAARALTEALRRAPRAMRVITQGCSSHGRRPALGADLTPVRSGVAPRLGAEAPTGTVPLHTLYCSPLRDLERGPLQREPGGAHHECNRRRRSRQRRKE